jgi:nicotinamidase-related amidase
MHALLIIDMQTGSFTEAPRYNAAEVVANINELAAQFRQQNKPVIYIQHDGTAEGCFLPGTEEWSLLLALHVQPSDIIVSKTANDCFYRSNLEKILQEHSADELVVTGCATDYCVNSTIRAALSKDYNITVVADGHTTGDRDAATADVVVALHNEIWADMIPTKGRVQVLPLQEVLKTLS